MPKDAPQVQGAPADVAQPESSLVRYLASLVKLRDVLAATPDATVACGRGAARLPAARLADMLALVDDAVVGKLTPAAADGALLFRRGDLSFVAKREDLPGARA